MNVLLVVPHNHHIGNFNHHHYINTTNIPLKKYIRTEQTILEAGLSSHPSNYYHLNHHHNHHSILGGGVDCGGRVASMYGLLLGLRSMLVFDLLAVSIIYQLPGIVVVVMAVVVLMVVGCVASWLCTDGGW